MVQPRPEQITSPFWLKNTLSCTTNSRSAEITVTVHKITREFECTVTIIVVWHITWAINSVTHVWGYRNYETDEDSRNNLIVGLISNGEGWHNNHHADPRSARHGPRHVRGGVLRD